MKHSVFRFVLIVCSSLLLCTACQSENTSSTLKIIKQDNTEVIFQVEVVETVEARMNGLMNRTEMAQNAGMLFVFQDADFRAFWMKNTLIPLDILYINDKGMIGHIHHHATPNDLTAIPSQIPTMYALEVNGGVASKQGITVGDEIFHEKIKRSLDE